MKCCGFHEILWNSMDFMKSSRFQFKFGGLQIMQISLWIYYRFNLQISLWISLWILWISYKIHLLPYERSGESEDLTRITCVYWFQVDFIWNPPDFTWQISCEIMRHSLPNVLHETEEIFLNYLIYKVLRKSAWNPHEIAGFHEICMKSAEFHEIHKYELWHDHQV